jgi:hypothetical protein
MDSMTASWPRAASSPRPGDPVVMHAERRQAPEILCGTQAVQSRAAHVPGERGYVPGHVGHRGVVASGGQSIARPWGASRDSALSMQDPAAGFAIAEESLPGDARGWCGLLLRRCIGFATDSCCTARRSSRAEAHRCGASVRPSSAARIAYASRANASTNASRVCTSSQSHDGLPGAM